MIFLKITAADGTKTFIPDSYVAQVTTGADATSAATAYASGRITRGKITGVKYYDGAAATVGALTVFPASRNIIPEEVTFTVDLRDIDLDRRHRYERQLMDTIEAITQKHQLTYTISEDTNSEPRYCATWLKTIIHQQCQALQLDAPELMSGPFHDALTLSYCCDYAMIFIRSKDGISHNPLEYSSYEDLALGTNVLLGTVLEILKK